MKKTVHPPAKPVLIAVVGPTASGKSELAVLLAKKYNGEIISVDSRQIYKGLDIGTGKVTGQWLDVPLDSHPVRVRRDTGSTIKKYNLTQKSFIYKKISHHLIDFANPKRQYSVAAFQKLANKAILNITRRDKLPILCGGTAHWMDAVVLNQTLPTVKPNPLLRKKLQSKSSDELFRLLKKLDPHRAKTIDPKNPRRLIRALEIVLSTGKPVPLITTHYSLFTPLWIGINPPQDILYAKIEKRLKQRIKQGMLCEVKKLHKAGVSWKRLESFGLEYKYCALFLQKKISEQEMLIQLLYAIKHYSKRQLTWWKRNSEINWIKNSIEAAQMTKVFLKNHSFN